MTDDQDQTARACLAGAESDAMTFPEIVGALADAGFDGYAVDFRRGTATYYLPSGAPLDLVAHNEAADVAGAFNPRAIAGAVLEAQQLVEGYTYRGFCRKIVDAGCAAYIVSFLGRRVLYYGRTGETHTELFPAQP